MLRCYVLRALYWVLTLLFVIWALNIKPCAIFRVWFGYVEILRRSHLIIQIYVFLCLLLSTFLLLIFSPSLLNFRVFWNIFLPLLILFMELEETEYVLPWLPQFMFEHDGDDGGGLCLAYDPSDTRRWTGWQSREWQQWRAAQHRFGSAHHGPGLMFTLWWWWCWIFKF